MMLSSKFAVSSNTEMLLSVLVMCNVVSLIPSNVAILASSVVVGSMITWLGMQLPLVIKYDEYLKDLIPNAPLMLLPLLFVVEMLSLLIRPVAMLLRISINMTCGHLLLTMSSMVVMWGNVVVMVMVMLLEISVALVQSYVMVMILVL